MKLAHRVCAGRRPERAPASRAGGCSRAKRSSSGISATQGGHQVAQKLSSSGLPRKLATSASSPPPGFGNASAQMSRLRPRRRRPRRATGRRRRCPRRCRGSRPAPADDPGAAFIAGASSERAAPPGRPLRCAARVAAGGRRAGRRSRARERERARRRADRRLGHEQAQDIDRTRPRGPSRCDVVVDAPVDQRDLGRLRVVAVEIDVDVVAAASRCRARPRRSGAAGNAASRSIQTRGDAAQRGQLARLGVGAEERR